MTERVVDPRGLRFSAALSVVTLAVALVTENLWVLGFQLLCFALGTVLGPVRSPYGLLFRTVVRPRLGPPAETEPEAPPRFAQAGGLAFTVVAAVGYLTGVDLLGALATALALLAAFLNAAFGLCLGCEVYLLALRLRPSSTRSG